MPFLKPSPGRKAEVVVVEHVVSMPRLYRQGQAEELQVGHVQNVLTKAVVNVGHQIL